mmetsp:Transcript_17631/g.26997  ORF Transcript_17631/g.26997 Transcript_17631/m.26997 type:complete len:145 (+) Transcript_17631:2-436(+)
MDNNNNNNNNGDFQDVLETLKENGYDCIDLTDNELAKVHVRHLAGGRSAVQNERLFRFDFPESPGALQRFLQSLDIRWNVSLFHYRNHGDDFGRVLVGIQEDEKSANNATTSGKLQRFLDKLGYNYTEETNNSVYRTFLLRGQE